MMTGAHDAITGTSNHHFGEFGEPSYTRSPNRRSTESASITDVHRDPAQRRREDPRFPADLFGAVLSVEPSTSFASSLAPRFDEQGFLCLKPVLEK